MLKDYHAVLLSEIRTKQDRFVCRYEKTYDFGFEAWKDIPVFVSNAIKRAKEDPYLQELLEEHPTDTLEGGEVKAVLYLDGELNDERKWKIK